MYCPSGEMTACLFFPVSVSFSTLSGRKAVGFVTALRNLRWSIFVAAKYQAEIEATIRIEAARAMLIGRDLRSFTGANAALAPVVLGPIRAASNIPFVGATREIVSGYSSWADRTLTLDGTAASSVRHSS